MYDYISIICYIFLEGSNNRIPNWNTKIHFPVPITQEVEENRAFRLQVIKKYSNMRQETSTMIRTFIIKHNNSKNDFIPCYIVKCMWVCLCVCTHVRLCVHGMEEKKGMGADEWSYNFLYQFLCCLNPGGFFEYDCQESVMLESEISLWRD